MPHVESHSECRQSPNQGNKYSIESQQHQNASAHSHAHDRLPFIFSVGANKEVEKQGHKKGREYFCLNLRSEEEKCGYAHSQTERDPLCVFAPEPDCRLTTHTQAVKMATKTCTIRMINS